MGTGRERETAIATDIWKESERERWLRDRETERDIYRETERDIGREGEMEESESEIDLNKVCSYILYSFG